MARLKAAVALSRKVLKVVAEGITTSFRYPHFMHGVQPTFDMPPPATIYGHICSALGEWVDPAGVEFAYHFTYVRRVDEVEHTHMVAASSGKLPGTQLPKVLEGAVNPFKRAVLFGPRLVLYINRPEWEGSFRSPRYAVVLGRSQDLFTYTAITVVELVRAPRAYFEHTLAPYDLGRRIARGVAVLMPRFLDYSSGRTPHFERYVMVTRRFTSEELLQSEGSQGEMFWVDPTSPEVDGAHLGLFFHSFVDAPEERTSPAGATSPD